MDLCKKNALDGRRKELRSLFRQDRRGSDRAGHLALVFLHQPATRCVHGSCFVDIPALDESIQVRPVFNPALRLDWHGHLSIRTRLAAPGTPMGWFKVSVDKCPDHCPADPCGRADNRLGGRPALEAGRCHRTASVVETSQPGRSHPVRCMCVRGLHGFDILRRSRAQGDSLVGSR